MKSRVEVELSQAQEISLLDRYGRGCSRETLVARAIAEVVALKMPWVKPVREKRERKADEPPLSIPPGMDMPKVEGADA